MVQYDSLQRLTDVVRQGQSGGNAVTAKHFTIGYNSLNQQTNISRYQSTGTTNAVATTDFTYDTDNRPSGIAHKQGTTNLNTYAYSYDALSRFTTITLTVEGTDTFSYDATSEVTGANDTSQANETYGFDLNGNRNTSGYTTSQNNQTTAGLGFTYQYDFEGNRTSRTETSTGKIQTYEWDYRNRLIRVTEKNSTSGPLTKEINYSYDAFNRLVKRTIDSDGAGSGLATTQYWAYDEGINSLVQFEGSTALTQSHRYLWSNTVDQLFADEQLTSLSTGGNVLYPLSDHLGTIRDIADFNESTGVTSVTNHRIYNAYGKLTAESNTAVDLLFGYTGKQLDEATGLQHNLYRWYDAALGQWLGEDPLSFGAGDENIRRYVGNRSAMNIDPDGLLQVVIPGIPLPIPIPLPTSWPAIPITIPLSGLPPIQNYLNPPPQPPNIIIPPNWQPPPIFVPPVPLPIPQQSDQYASYELYMQYLDNQRYMQNQQYIQNAQQESVKYQQYIQQQTA